MLRWRNIICVSVCVCWAPSPSSSSTVSSCLSSGMDRNLFLKWRHHWHRHYYHHQWNKTRASGWNPQEEINVNDVQHALKRLSQTLSGGSDQEEERETNYVKVEETHSIKVKRKEREKEIGIAFPFLNKKKLSSVTRYWLWPFKSAAFLALPFSKKKRQTNRSQRFAAAAADERNDEKSWIERAKSDWERKGNVWRGETLRWLL